MNGKGFEIVDIVSLNSEKVEAMGNELIRCSIMGNKLRC